MNPFKNRTKYQRENLKLQPGDLVYTAKTGDTVVPEVIQIKIIGDCEDGDGYEALTTANAPYRSVTHKDGSIEWLTSSVIHTCNMPIFRSKKEAKEHAKYLTQQEIKSLKEQVSILSKYINNYLYWQNTPPIYKTLDESLIFIPPEEEN